jgi:preprotein translocase subunit YajC
MAWPLLVLSFLLIQDAPAVKPAADKAAATAPAAGDKPAPADDKAPAIVEAPAADEAEVKPAAKAAAGAKPAAPAGPDNPFGMLMYLGPIILIFYLLILRPQNKQASKHKDLLNNLKKNDKVVTTGGICGTVMSTDPASDRVVVRVDDDKGVKLTFTKASIVRVIEPQPEKAAESTSS